MIEIISVDDLSRRFGELISYLHQSYGLSDEQIGHTIFASPFFDFLERNEAERFLASSLDDIGANLFPQSGRIPALVVADARYVWAGESALRLSLYFSLPLKSFFLLLPLTRLLSLFEPYHEMSFDQLATLAKERYCSRGLFSLLLQKCGTNVRHVSLKSGVGEETLFHAACNNNAFYGLSSQSVLALLSSLPISSSYFTRESRFAYLEPFYLRERIFLERLSAACLALLPPRLKSYASLPLALNDEVGEEVYRFSFGDDPLLLEKTLGSPFAFLLVFGNPGFYQEKGKKKMVFRPEDQDLALTLASREYRQLLRQEK